MGNVSFELNTIFGILHEKKTKIRVGKFGKLRPLLSWEIKASGNQ